MDGGDGGRGDGGLAMDDDDYWQLAMAMRCPEPKGEKRERWRELEFQEGEPPHIGSIQSLCGVFWSFGLLVCWPCCLRFLFLSGGSVPVDRKVWVRGT
jgi:hypothetical protein